MKSNPQLNLRLKPHLSEWLGLEAKRTERSKTWLVNSYIERAMLNMDRQEFTNERSPEGCSLQGLEIQPVR